MVINDVRSLSRQYIPAWGNAEQFIAVHYLGVAGQNNKINSDGCGAHFYIYWDGRTWQAADLNAILWQVGTAGYYTQKHPYARNSNTVGIEICPKCDGTGKYAEDPKWYFTEESQEACVELVQYLMKVMKVGPDHVLRHFDIVNKYCPAPYVTNNKYRTSWTWDEFKAKISQSSGGTLKPAKPDKVAINVDVYYVKNGETLSNIAKRMGTTVSILAKYNGISNPDMISVGQAIKNPNKTRYHKTYDFLPESVSLGSKGISVLLLQEILTARGLYSGALDRDSGEGTVKAINAYQSLRRKQGKEIGTNGHNDSVCGKGMWEDLLALPKTGNKFSVSPVSGDSDGVSTLLLQEILKARGMYSGALDRDYGPILMNGINSYQKLRMTQGKKIGNGIGDGICDIDMWKDLIAM